MSEFTHTWPDQNQFGVDISNITATGVISGTPVYVGWTPGAPSIAHDGTSPNSGATLELPVNAYVYYGSGSESLTIAFDVAGTGGVGLALIGATAVGNLSSGGPLGVSLTVTSSGGPIAGSSGGVINLSPPLAAVHVSQTVTLSVDGPLDFALLSYALFQLLTGPMSSASVDYSVGALSINGLAASCAGVVTRAVGGRAAAAVTGPGCAAVCLRVDLLRGGCLLRIAAACVAERIVAACPIVRIAAACVAERVAAAGPIVRIAGRKSCTHTGDNALPPSRLSPKHPAAVRPIAFDFSELMAPIAGDPPPATDPLTSCSVVVSPSGAGALSGSAVAVSGRTAALTVSGGVDGVDYTFTATGTLASGWVDVIVANLAVTVNP